MCSNSDVMKKRKKSKPANIAIQPETDRMNTPVPDRKATHPVSATEAALFKQAENPLGDPGKI